jgi:hypothetical protein
MDWIKFLESNRITFDTRGKNVSGNHVAISCPFCGGDDPSRHLAINLDGAGWHCWRNPQHRGRSAVRLIRELLHCSSEQARAIAGESNQTVPENLTEVIRAMLEPEKAADQPLAMPDDFRRFGNQYSAKRFTQYLRQRHFPTPLDELAREHDVMYSMTGDFHGRVIFLVRSAQGELMAWSGRSIYPSEHLRYKTHGPIGHYLLWLDKLPRPKSDTLVLCEGPFDSFKVSALGKSLGIDATCCFTSTPTKRQIDHLYQLRPHYKHIYVMLDRGEIANTLWTTDALAPLRIKPIWLADHKDPAEFRSVDELRRVMGLALA